MMRYKAIIAYDGTDFHGWQVQANASTIASTMQQSFLRTFRTPVSILGASRTDAGVHAIGQTALCTTELNLDPQKIMTAWNASLPASIVIRSLEFAAPEFHPFANVISKTYYYHLFLKRPLPHVARYGWFWDFIDRVDIEKLEKTLPLFIGEHDFGSFCKQEAEKEQSTVRTIQSIGIKKLKRFGALQIHVMSSGFLRYQIRRMIGAALDVASKPELPIDTITYHLKNPNPQQNFTRAEGCGLCLRKIVYKEGKKNERNN